MNVNIHILWWELSKPGCQPGLSDLKQEAGREASVWIEQFYWEWIMDQLVLKSTYKQND